MGSRASDAALIWSSVATLTQWFYKTTDYAQRLLDDMEMLELSWPERVLTMQRNWIGRSEGAKVTFTIEETGDESSKTSRHDPTRCGASRSSCSRSSTRS